MTFMIRNAQGRIYGLCTNRPGPGNRLPDGSEEIVEYLERDPAKPGYDAAKIAEANAFSDDQAAKLELSGKRAAALKAIDDERLADAAARPDAPQAVKDYADLLRA